jgi:hypothetical protein
MVYNNYIELKNKRNYIMTRDVAIKLNKVSGKYECQINGKGFASTKPAYIEYMYRKLTGAKASFQSIMEMAGESQAVETVATKFDINKRFSFVEQLVKMVAANVQASAIVTGQGGLGKTYTVQKTLESAGYLDLSNMADFQADMVINKAKTYTMVKGYSTAKGLYRTLFELNNSVIVFDDCDDVLKDPTALNLLKGALDSNGRRIISWRADFRDDDLPRSFEFTGRIIFISNLNQSRVDQAIRSRSMMIDLTMTDDQKIDRMAYISKSSDFMPEFELSSKEDALQLIRELKDSAKEISLRTLISVTKIRAAGDSDWKGLAEYILCA